MEKRALIAFALSMAVFFLYMEFFGPRPPAPQAPAAPATEATEARQTEEAPAGAEAPAEIRTAQPATEQRAVAAPVTEQTAKLENEKVQATFSSQRAISAWMLKKYGETASDEAPRVDLIDPEEPRSAVDLSLTGAHEPENLAIVDTAPEGVTMTAQTAGLIETRSWSLDGYVAELKWSARNTSGRAVVLEPSIRFTEPVDFESMSQYDVHGPIVARGTEVDRLDEDDVLEKLAFTNVSWAGLDHKYFLKVAIPPSGMREVSARVAELGRENNVSLVALTTRLPKQLVQPGEEWSQTLRIYMGPKASTDLRGVSPDLEQAIDHGFFGFLARPLLALLNLFERGVGNYGIAIILVTVLIKILFYPLTRKSFTAMRDMQRVQPKLEAIKKKFGDDKEKLNREMMNLYRTEGINPLGGCLPILLQIPVFFALYQVLLNAIELRHAPFMLWVNDLSAPEELFSLEIAGLTLPFRLLPLIMGATMVLQQRLTPSTMDKAQQKVMMLMPIVFTFLFWGFPSGLVLYWLVNNVISISQQWWITRGTKTA